MNIDDLDIDSIIMKKFVKPLNYELDIVFQKIDGIKFKHGETNSILRQIYTSFDTAHKIIENDDFISFNVEMRSIYEYIAMAVSLQENDATFDEFKNLTIKQKEMSETKPFKIFETLNESVISIIKNKYYDDVLEDDEKEYIGKMKLYGVYKELCKYTHGSLYSSSYINIIQPKEKEWLKLNNWITYYFVKFVYYLVLSYYSNTDTLICGENVLYTCILYVYKIITYAKENNVSNECINNMLYIDFNTEYFNNSKQNAELVASQINMILNLIMQNEELGDSFEQYLSINDNS